MKRMIGFVVLATILPCLMAEEVTENKNFRGEVNFDTPCIWKIQGTKVTSSAAELNIMDGVTATADEINAAADASGRATTATVADNTSVTLSASTPYVVITGTGQALNASCDIDFAQPFPNQTEFVIMCAHGSTNYIRFSNTTAQVIGDTTTLRPGDAVVLYSQATNKLCLGGQGVITSNRLAAADFGAITVAAGGGVSIDSDGLPATVTSVTTISNNNMKVFGSNLVITAGGTVTVPADSVSLDAVNGITASAAEINAAGAGTTATLTPTLVSNNNAKVFCSNLVVTAGGTVTVPADSVSLDAVNGITASAAEINAAGAGTTATLTPTLVSNDNAKVFCSNLLVTAGGTVSVPADSVSLDAVNGITASAAEINAAGAGTTATLTPASITVSTNLVADKKFVQTPETLTLTAGDFTLTPTSSVYFVAGHYGVVTMTLANATSPGMPLEIINLVGTNVVYVDGTISMTVFPTGYTTWTNGQYESIQFRSQDTNWICVGHNP